MSDPSAKKLVVGVSAILLGSTGIHKFMLGYPQEGAILLLTSVLSGFFAVPFISILGILEGISYLRKSDQEFSETYIQHQKKWF